MLQNLCNMITDDCEQREMRGHANCPQHFAKQSFKCNDFPRRVSTGRSRIRDGVLFDASLHLLQKAAEGFTKTHALRRPEFTSAGLAQRGGGRSYRPHRRPFFSLDRHNASFLATDNGEEGFQGVGKAFQGRGNA